MCNLYHEAPRDHVERYVRAIMPEYAAVPVGPFGTGLFLRPIDGRLHKAALDDDHTSTLPFLDPTAVR